MTIPSELVNLIKRKDVVLFLGAGLAMNSGLPGWVDLIRPLAQSLNARWPPDEKDLNTEHLLTIARYYENQFGRNELIRFILDKLDTTRISPSMPHYLITLLPAQLIFTTNYDDLLERAYRETGIQARPVISEIELSYWREKYVQIIKLCGDLTRPESIKITKSDFNIYTETNRRLLENLHTTLETKTALFIGYGLRDPFINQIWDNINWRFKEHQRSAYATFFDISPLDFQDLKKRNIIPIILDNKGADKTATLASWLTDLVYLSLVSVSPEHLQEVLKHIDNRDILEKLRNMEQKK